METSAEVPALGSLEISGKVLRSNTRKVKNRLSEAFRLAASGLRNTKSKLGEHNRRMRGRLGKAEGITASAHKLARIVYSIIKSGHAYDEAKAFPERPGNRQKQMRTLKNLAQKLDLEIQKIPAATTS